MSGPIQRVLAWLGMKPRGRTHQSVAGKSANPFGLHDMHGNVWEWCEDTYDSEGAPSDGSARVDPAASYRAFRGGGWWFAAGRARSADRSGDVPGGRGVDLGFRPARSVRTTD